MNYIEHYFSNMWSNIYEVSLPTVGLDDNAFPAFIEADITSDAEVPVCVANYCKRFRALNMDKVVYVLSNGYDYDGRRTMHHKTVSTILRRFGMVNNNSMRVAHIVTTKGVHYFGGMGFIMDSNYNPLLICTAKVDFDSNGRIKFSNPKCNISYRVFDNSSELLEKTIIKQAIPYLSHHTVPIPAGMHHDYSYVDIMIGDFDYMVVKPVRPTMKQAEPESINSVILNSYDH